jgi:DNA invertase Pin-like site-specific DNA recombinase
MSRVKEIVMTELSLNGAADAEVRELAHREWLEAARRGGLELAKFDPDAKLEERIAWALGAGLVVAVLYARFSTKHQNSTADQVRACVVYAASHGMYVPPELICADEGVKGRKIRRDGLDRLKAILKSRQATVLLVYKVSRLFRQANMGFQLVQQEVVEEGLRAVSVSQGIDTADEKSWKAQLQLHGLLDDLLLDAIADHVREGLVGHFKKGWTTGALPVGYRPVEVPGAPPTKRGRPRTMPEVHPEVAALTRQHYEWVRDGMTLADGLRRWWAAGGPCAPQATTGRMTAHAYRRMLSNVRYTGRWEFGRKRSRWSTKKDYTVQKRQPDAAVHVRQCEELRIVSDELFAAVQGRLKELEKGPRVRRGVQESRAIDLITDVYWCPHCNHRYYTAGRECLSMKCPQADCPARACIRRDEAFTALCERLAEMLVQDQNLVRQVVEAVGRLDARGDDELAAERTAAMRRVDSLARKIDDLVDLAGEGSDEDRAARKKRIRVAEAERAAAKADLARLSRPQPAKEVTEADVRGAVANLAGLLTEGGTGQLGPDAVFKCATIVRRLVGGRVYVHADRRPARKRSVVRGVFTPHLLDVVTDVVGIPTPVATSPVPAAVEVWLRKPPRLDLLGPEVVRLYEMEGLGFREIGLRLGINSGNAWLSYQRYYEIRGLPMPPRRPLNYRPRKAS